MNDQPGHSNDPHGVIRRFGRVAVRLLGVLIIGSMALIGVQNEQAGHRWFDIFDEAAHFDYVLKLSHGDIPTWGSTYEQETMRIADCLGNAFTTPVLDCDVKEREPQNYPPNGYNYEAQQPPLAYLAYLPGLMLAGDREPGPTLNWVRDTGGTLQLLVGCALLFVIASQLRLGFWRTSLLSGIVLLAPMSVHAFSIVSNDAATTLASLAFLSLFLATRRRSTSAIVLLGAIAGLVLGATKTSAILLPAGFLAALLLLEAIRAFRERRNSAPSILEWLRTFLSRADVRFVLVALIVSLVLAVGFTLWQSARSSTPSSVVLSAVMGILPLVDAVQPETVVSSVANLSNHWLGASNGLVTSSQFFVAVNAFVLVLIGVAFARSRESDGGRSRLLASAWAVIIGVFSLAWPVLLLLQGGFNFDTPQRYGLLILPVAAVAIAGSLGFGDGRRRSRPDDESDDESALDHTVAVADAR